MDIRDELQNKRFRLNKPFENLFARWQRNMFRLNTALIWIALVIEVISAVGKMTERVESFGITGYLMHCILLPFLINVAIYFIGICMYRHPKISDEERVAVPILTMIAMFTTLVSIHYMFPVLLGMFTIPVFISTIYANRNVVIRTFAFCCLGIAVSVALTCINHYSTLSSEYFTSLFIIAAIMAFVFVVAMGTVENERAKVEAIKRNMQNTARLRQEASHDSLTGLYNRKTILDILKSYMTDVNSGSSSALYISVIDIDHFKQINDSYGHSVGDIVLKKLADMFRVMNSGNTVVGRYGGEEFIVIFTGLGYEEVYRRVNGLRVRLAEYDFAELNGRQVTVSAGIAAYRRNQDMIEFFDEADRAMYKAKKLGRNRIEKAG